MTNLFQAIAEHNVKVVAQHLADRSFSPYVINDKGQTPLKFATQLRYQFSLGRDHRGNIAAAVEKQQHLVDIIEMLQARKNKIKQFELEGADSPVDDQSVELNEVTL